jgi:ABC-type nitrate/sulfonate/bicarbonate transport system permease component
MQSAAAVAGLAVVWQLVVWSALVPPEYFPAPATVLDALVETVRTGELTRAIATTFMRAVTGLAAATLFGLALAVVSARYSLIGRAFTPVADLFRSLPPAAITPISIFFLGLGWKLYAFILIFACFWPVYMNAYAALTAVPRQQLATASIYGYEGWARMLRVQLPAALPDAFIGIRLAASVALIASIVAEMLAGRDGLGYMMSSAAFSLRIPDMFVAMVSTMLLGGVMNQIVVLARHLVIGWHRTMTAINRGA